jgi:hypothetical protein
MRCKTMVCDYCWEDEAVFSRRIEPRADPAKEDREALRSGGGAVSRTEALLDSFVDVKRRIENAEKFDSRGD